MPFLLGQVPDPTAGATHFLNPTVVRKRRGGSLPSWARGEGLPIGRHIFYSPTESGAPPELKAISVGLEDPSSCARPEEPVKLYRAESGWSWQG
jgi:hypothetical protein